MKIIDNRELFEVEFNSESMIVLALNLNSAITHVLTEHSLDDEDEYIRGEKLSDKECLNTMAFDENMEGKTKLIDWIKEEINPGDKPIILTYSEV